MSDLLAFISESPSPHHCVAAAAVRLEAAGFRRLRETAAWTLAPGEGWYALREGALVAFRVGSTPAAEAGFRLIGAHSDSPNLRVKPIPDVSASGYQQLGVEVYGGALTYTWLDRDLGLAGPVMLKGRPGGPRLEQRLCRIDQAILRVPSLAIHLNRDVRTKGLKLNDQTHLVPVLGLAPEKSDAAASDAKPDPSVPGALRRLLGQRLDVDPARLLSWELSLFDLSPPTLGGIDDAFVFSARLDNQAMCHAALRALVSAKAAAATAVICLYDHEEVGSGSTSGAAGPFVEDVLRRLAEVEGPGATHGALPRAVARAFQVSADMAHAVHPNHADRHEPEHRPRLNGGPVIKVNSQQRYATGSEGAALFESLCVDLGLRPQKFVARTDLPCGSTIGPISAARLGIRTVDVGNPMLSMHSIREQAGRLDHEPMIRVMTSFLEADLGGAA